MGVFEEKFAEWKKPVLIIVITLSVYLCFRYLLTLILPFIFAYFLAWIIHPVTEAMYRRLKLPKIIGGTLALLLLFAVFGTSFCMLINVLIRQTITLIKNLPVYINLLSVRLDIICSWCDRVFELDCGTIRAFVDENMIQGMNKMSSGLVPKLTQHTIQITIGFMGFLGILLIVLVAAVLIVKDKAELQDTFKESRIYRECHKITRRLSEVGMAYLRTQGIIMIIVAVICILGLSLLHNSYAFLIGVGIAFMDALPVLGSFLVLIPWAIISLVSGNIYEAAILITIYLICQIIREVLEPKLIGNRIGIRPLFTLIAMYVGVKLFSVAGFVLGPVGLIVIQTIYQVVNEYALPDTGDHPGKGPSR